MKKFFKVFGILLFSILLIAYLAFLFILPKVVDLNKYKPLVQKIAKEQANLLIDYGNVKILTTPLLGIGIKTDNINVKMIDNTEVFSAKSFKGRIALPSLLLFTVKVSCAEIDSPKINLDIINDKEFKILKIVEQKLNEKELNIEKNIPKAEKNTIPTELIRIKIPTVKIKNYNAKINDLKSGHSLTLLGENLVLGYFNGKTFRVKTDAKLLSDNKTNITANIDINSFIPPQNKLDEDDDPVQRIELPFVNPVSLYKDYNLKTDINTKLRIRQNKNNITMRGFFNVDNFTMTLSGLQLPKSYTHTQFKGTKVLTDTSIFITPEQNIKLFGKLKYGKLPYLNLKLITQKIYFNDLIILTKAFLDTLQIKNDLADLTGKGYFEINTDIKTNFKHLNSNGKIIVHDGNITNKRHGLVLSKINSHISLDNDMLNIVESKAFVNDKILKAEGKIDNKANVNISIFAEKLPLSILFTAFAPPDIKKSLSLNSGNLFINAKITGTLKKIEASTKLAITDFILNEKNNNFKVINEKIIVNFNKNIKNIQYDILNKNFKIIIPHSDSVITNAQIKLNANDKILNIDSSDIKINNFSTLKIAGTIEDYNKAFIPNINVNGQLYADDLKKLAGKEAEPFLKSSGIIPLKISYTGNKTKQTLIAQLVADNSNYITPINIQSVLGKQTIMQTKVDFKHNRIRIKETGIFTKNLPSQFTNDLAQNMTDTNKILEISGTITDIDKSEPFINLFKIIIPKDLDVSLTAFPNSILTLHGKLFIFGKTNLPRIRGSINLTDGYIPDLALTLNKAAMRFKGREVSLNVRNLLINGSDINLTSDIPLMTSNPTLSNVGFSSQNIDVDKLMKVSETATQMFTPKTKQYSKKNVTNNSNIPIRITNGFINIKNAKTGTIIARNTTGRISLFDNVFYLNNFRTHAFNGIIRGNISANLVNSRLNLITRGSGLSIKKLLLDTAGMKDTISGTLSFNTRLSLQGATQTEQMKSLKGNLHFEIHKGQFGPFGKLENFLLADNLRNSPVFQTAIGSIVASIATVDISHFDVMKGNLSFNDGIANINQITSSGNVLSLNISGNMNLLDNHIDTRARGRLASQISDMLGPIAAINPINVLKVTPELNVATAKAFSLFTEQITEDEMKLIPEFDTKQSNFNATKFQIILKGDTAKPLKLVKSFKWLAVSSDIENAKAFVATLPEPEIDKKGTELQTIEEIEQYNAKTSTKIKRFFNRNKKEKLKKEEKINENTREIQTEEKQGQQDENIKE